MTGNKTLRELETEQRRGKKRFLERKTQEYEADKLIKDFLEHEDFSDEGRDDRQDGDRPIRSQRG